MGAVGTAFGVGILLIGIVVILSFGTDFFTSLLDASGQFFTATKLKVNPNANELICDLKITTNVDIVQDIPISNPKFFIPPEASHTYEYIERTCFLPQNYVTFNLIDGGVGQAPRINAVDTANLQTNILVLPFGGEVVQQIRLVDARDGTQVVDWNLQPNLSYTTQLPTGLAIASPLSVDATFIVSNIPVREYNLEIHASGLPEGINNQPIGVPFKSKICDQFHVLKNGQCLPF